MKRFIIILPLVLFILGLGIVWGGIILGRYGEGVSESRETRDTFRTIQTLEGLDGVEYALIRDNERIAYNLGVRYFERGEWSKAILSFRKITENSSRGEFRAKAHYNTGVVYLALYSQSREQSVLQLAIDHFREALRANPLEEDARYNLEKLFHSISLGIFPGPPDKNSGDGYGESIPEEDF